MYNTTLANYSHPDGVYVYCYPNKGVNMYKGIEQYLNKQSVVVFNSYLYFWIENKETIDIDPVKYNK